MKAIIIAAISCVSLHGSSQEISGIKFEQGLTWNQVKEKASKENKYIFVDCYATWCKPCKEMDENVYPNDKVGSFANQNFISVKVQMDSAKKDNENIRLLYPAAREFESMYRISALPSYLFFSPVGELVHRAAGSQSVNDFLQLLTDATISQKQLYTQVKSWQAGSMPLSEIGGFIGALKDNGEDSLSRLVTRKYIESLNTLSSDALITKENLVFLSSNRHQIKSTDRIYSLYLSEENKIDSIIKVKGHAKDMVKAVIVNEEILRPVQTAINENRKPQWRAIQQNLDIKYGQDYQVLEVMWTRIKYSEATKKDWDETIETVMKNWKKYEKAFAEQGISALDVLASTIYNHSNKKGHLKAAAEWLKIASYFNFGDHFDINWERAVVLHKLGGKSNREEAIKLANQFIGVMKRDSKDPCRSEEDRNWLLKITPGYMKLVEDMKNGKPYPNKL